MSKQELHARIKEENSVNLDSIALSEKRSRSSMTDILLSEAIEARLRVNNRIKELKEEMKCTGCMPGDNGMSFVCREQHINNKVDCVHQYLPFGKQVDGFRQAICKNCGHTPDIKEVRFDHNLNKL